MVSGDIIGFDFFGQIHSRKFCISISLHVIFGSTGQMFRFYLSNSCLFMFATTAKLFQIRQTNVACLIMTELYDEKFKFANGQKNNNICTM